MSTMKTDIQHALDGLAGELEALSRKIHDHPELGYQEVQASGWLCAMTTYDLLADPARVRPAKEEFARG